MTSEACPRCGSSGRIALVEIQGVYDGGLYYLCMGCEVDWHRWPEGHDLRELAARYMKGGASEG